MAKHNKEKTSTGSSKSDSPAILSPATAAPVNLSQKQMSYSPNQKKYATLQKKSPVLLPNILPNILRKNYLGTLQTPSTQNFQIVCATPEVQSPPVSAKVSEAVSPIIITIPGAVNSFGYQSLLFGSSNKQIPVSSVPLTSVTESSATKAFASNVPTATTTSLAPYALATNVQVNNQNQDILGFFIPPNLVTPTLPVVSPVNTAKYKILPYAKFPQSLEPGVMNLIATTPYSNIYSPSNIPPSNVQSNSLTTNSNVVSPSVSSSNNIYTYKTMVTDAPKTNPPVSNQSVIGINVYKPKLKPNSSDKNTSKYLEQTPATSYNSLLINNKTISKLLGHKPEIYPKLLFQPGEKEEMPDQSDCGNNIKVEAVWSVRDVERNLSDGTFIDLDLVEPLSGDCLESSKPSQQSLKSTLESVKKTLDSNAIVIDDRTVFEPAENNLSRVTEPESGKLIVESPHSNVISKKESTSEESNLVVSSNVDNVTKIKTEPLDLKTTSINVNLYPKEKNELYGGNFYICGFSNCSFSSLVQDEFVEHLRCVHSKQKKDYVCAHCGQAFPVIDCFLKHLSTHVSTDMFLLYSCSLCGFNTNLVKMFVQHNDSVHSEEKEFCCAYCGLIFQCSAELLQHLQLNLLKYVHCPHCEAKNSQRQQILKHIQVKHPGKSKCIFVTSQIICKEKQKVLNDVVNLLSDESDCD
ncbi:uncharacterized protein LOC106867237 [Octopus bimaculoides]|uniref:C2H2-type domain-containing protein n=1 Tax=Octopus bimaculoides TaxID=37653 RepID=A0A0L8I221_OCTBM|nr:uncharacterized protein LOC106867237 [Octopus bimaculoides]XP_014767534.1 uncharacterized protein LOC106867237 [Octopus bimaculoides]XP_052824504.1 uncharacterized protein LOC106867237 [Octopus bimaculoides]|eukprot:XP_014767533.1 PREDICTED: uncharacterized protein LOC106867237 [Octopus bimaculoides]